VSPIVSADAFESVSSNSADTTLAVCIKHTRHVKLATMQLQIHIEILLTWRLITDKC